MLKVLWFAPDWAVTAQAAMEKPTDIFLLPARTRAEVLSYLTNSAYDVLLACPPLPGLATDDLLDQVHRIDSSLPVVLWQNNSDVDEAIRLTKQGAYHVLSSPIAPAKLYDTIRSAAMCTQGRPARQADAGEPWRTSLIGESSPMQRVAEVIRLIAARRSTVLISGETGTGKELVARAIHMASGRGQLPMISVNCSAIPENLLEAELFGHVKGAFTGALQSRIGRFEQANGSTIFLDEIGDMPLELQAKLLRVLQEREIQRVGSSETVRLNIRVVAATNLDLEEQVRQKRFRQDLFYRLNVVPLRLPALKDRREDIPALVQHFVEKVCALEALPVKRVSSETLARLSEYAWPGNVRQLEHAVEMAVVLSGNRTLLFANDFQLDINNVAQASTHTASPFIQVPDEGLDFDETVSRLERSIVEQALVKSGGNKARAADLLRMKRTTLLAKMKAFDFNIARIPEGVCA